MRAGGRQVSCLSRSHHAAATSFRPMNKRSLFAYPTSPCYPSLRASEQTNVQTATTTHHREGGRGTRNLPSISTKLNNTSHVNVPVYSICMNTPYIHDRPNALPRKLGDQASAVNRKTAPLKGRYTFVGHRILARSTLDHHC